MPTFNMNILIVLLMGLSGPIASAKESSDKATQYSRLFQRQDLLQRSYRDTYLALTDINKQESLQTWYRLFLKNEKNRKIFNTTMGNIHSWVKGKDYRLLLYYYSVTGQIEQAAQTLGLYLLSAYSLLDNFSQNPQAKNWSHQTQLSIQSSLKRFDLEKIEQIRGCYSQFLQQKKVNRQFNIYNSYFVYQGLKSCVSYDRFVFVLNDLLDQLFRIEKYPGAPFPISFTGYVSDNDVQLLDRIAMSPTDILMLGQQLNLITHLSAPNFNKPYSQLSIDEFKTLMTTPEAAITDLFTREEGLQNIYDIESLNEIGAISTDQFYGHPSFQTINGQNGIFGQMVQSIREAKESVFIDIFWMGGSIGMNLAKELMKKVIENPDFTVVIISDNENKFQYGTELDMIYRYMRAFSEKFTSDKDRAYNFYITPADIGIKRTALPEFVDLLVTNNVVNKLHSNKDLKSILQNDGFYLLAKSDHTKVMIMDGKNPQTGVAYIGSKNWTDSSGGANYDEVAALRGPVTALLLDTFYYDVLEAFELDTKVNLGGNMVTKHIQAKFPNLKKRQAIEQLLAPIDVLNRFSNTNYDVAYIPKGEVTIAPAQNNVYGTEMSPVEQNIETILMAKKQILIDDQFLYDPQIIEALKVARTEHGVEIFIIIESLMPYEVSPQALTQGAHLPNILFVPELFDAGIQVKWHHPPEKLRQAILEDSALHPKQQITATFHPKALSVDGVAFEDAQKCLTGESIQLSTENTPAVITGSANKDVMTMSGGFREAQVAIYDQDTVIQHDCLFWSRWHDSGVTTNTNGMDFELPQQAANMGISEKPVFLNLIRQLFFSMYNFSKDFF